MKNIEDTNQVIRHLKWSMYFKVSAWDTHKDEYYHECDDQLPLEDLLHALVHDICNRMEGIHDEYSYRYAFNLVFTDLAIDRETGLKVETLAEIIFLYFTNQTNNYPDLCDMMFSLYITTEHGETPSQTLICAFELALWVKQYLNSPEIFQVSHTDSSNLTIEDIPF